MSTSPKKIIFEEAARSALLKGICQLADAVAFTLGPKGRNVGIEKRWGVPTITNDGCYVAREIENEDQYENMGILIGKEAVQKIKESCGDGTTTGTIILRALVEEGIRYISAGASPITVKRGIDKAVEAIVAEIERMATPVTDNEQIENIATASASGNREVGRMIAEAIENVGKDGVVTVEEGKEVKTSIEIVEGMRFDRGYISPYFCTDAEKMVAELDNPDILVIDKKINNIHEILPVLQMAASSRRPLLIIAEEFDGDTLSTLVLNRLHGRINVTAVKAPGFGDRRKQMLEDIAVLTGGKAVSADAGIDLQSVEQDSFGSAERVIVGKEYTTIINGKGEEKAIKGRISQLEHEIAETTSSYDREKLEERKAKLSGGVAVIKVGGTTEPELKQRKQVFEDSLNSTRAAQAEGVVLGGGVAFLLASACLDKLQVNDEERIGVNVVKKAILAPLKQLVENVGHDGSVVVEQIRKKGGSFGFNAETECVEDLKKAGIFDPAKVAKTVLIDASSSAGIVLLTEALMADEEEEAAE